MANKDGTGPEGKGPRTGRGKGSCPPDRKNVEAMGREAMSQNCWWLKGKKKKK